MTLKPPPIYMALLVLVLLIVCSGCEAFSPLENAQAFRPRTSTDPTNTTTTTTTTTTTDANVSVAGTLVASSAVDADGCAVSSDTTFDINDDVYLVLQNAAFPTGTTMFARLYRDNRALEDTRELVAEQDYSNVCVYFVFSPAVGAQVWETGAYGIEFYMNGNSYGAVDFEIE